jgi:hypothetical protein
MAKDEASLVRAGECYTLPEFRRRTGLENAAIRSARRAGLIVRRVGRRSYVLGDDFLEFLRTHADRVTA